MTMRVSSDIANYKLTTIFILKVHSILILDNGTGAWEILGGAKQVNRNLFGKDRSCYHKCSEGNLLPHASATSGIAYLIAVRGLSKEDRLEN